MDANQEYKVSPHLSKIKMERLWGKLVPLPFLASKERLLHHFLFAGWLFSSSPARSRSTLTCLQKQSIFQFLSDSASVLSPYWLSKNSLWLWRAQNDPEKHLTTSASYSYHGRGHNYTFQKLVCGQLGEPCIRFNSPFVNIKSRYMGSVHTFLFSTYITVWKIWPETAFFLKFPYLNTGCNLCKNVTYGLHH